MLSGALIFLLSSCGKEEFNNIDFISPEGKTDTIIIESIVEVRGNGEGTYDGIYVTCDATDHTASIFNQRHFLAYGTDLEIINGQAVWEEPLYVLHWSSLNSNLNEGNYLVEGYFWDSALPEEELCFNLSITQITPFTISGEFSTIDGSPIQRSGTFTTEIYACEDLEIEPDDFELSQYTDGRITTFSSRSENGDKQMSIAILCSDRFVDLADTTRIIVGGGKLKVQDSGELNVEEDSNFGIIIDVEQEYELNKNLKAYYLNDFSLDANGIILSSYANTIAMGQEISVLIESESNGYYIGIFSGTLEDGTQIEGEFISRIISC